MRNSRFTPAPAALALLLSCALPHAAHAQTQPAALEVSIAPMPLGQALNELARQAGMEVSFPAGQAASGPAPALSGTMTVEQALRRLLAGSELTGEVRNGTIIVRRHAPALSETTLEAVTVSGRMAAQGGEQDGYVSDRISAVGPWEGRDLQDTPYSISVASADLIENVQATTPDQIFRMTPTTQLSWPQSQNDTPFVYMRGFSVGVPARNGLPGAMYGHGTTTEDTERIEILSGLSGFLYGPGNVGGMINYVTKRPTAQRLNSITAGYTGGRNGYVHGDFGGPIDEAGRFGYRINAVVQDGDTRVEDYSMRKRFISAAFDWRPTDRLLLQVDGSHRDYHSTRQAYWSVAPGAKRPSASDLDPTKLWSQPWTYYDVESRRLGANLRWEATDAITLRAGYLNRVDTRSYIFSTNTFQADGTYTQRTNKAAPQHMTGHAWNAFADFAFQTGPVSHKLTVGYLATSNTRYNHLDASANAPDVPGLPLDHPVYQPEPQWPELGKQRSWNSAVNRQESWTIGDDITFNDQWSMLIGLSRATIRNDTRDAPDAPWKTAYKKSANTPTVSLIFKPTPAVTTYATYMEALEQGGVAADLYNGFPVTNAGAAFDPLISKQIEVGAKATVGGMLLTGALFQIDKGLQYYDISDPARPTYVQDGRQVHRGLELTATGKLTSNLTLIGGFTWLDAKVKQQKQNPALEGKRPVGVASRMFKLYGEYQVPGVAGLTLNGGVSYTSASWGDAMNTDRLPGYTVVDVGARYVMDAGGYPLTWRLNVNNLTNKRYWVNQQYLGDARTVMLSANLRF